VNPNGPHGLPPAMTTSATEPLGCSTCATAASAKCDWARMPAGCPTRTQPELSHDPAPYLSPERRALMLAADSTPFAEDRRLRSRVEELVAFAQARGIRKVGVAFCVSLIREAQRLGEILREAGIGAELACCRAGAVDQGEVGLPKAHPEKFASSCNPVGQARLLDAAGVGLVAQLGLCLGHDLILQEECAAPVTTLVVKDRALDHHPVQALRPARRAG
jgi:uncharacterized metal-binding protein